MLTPKVQQLVPEGMQVETTEPNWAVACVMITSHAMRALGYLEAGNAELAKEALQELREFTENPILRIRVR
jgi:hypothetical protein